jgi:predicted RNase H-like nuclease
MWGISMGERITIIGIDCATEPIKTGLSLGRYENGKVELIDIRTGSNSIPISSVIIEWINSNDKILLAIDAPLGWPENLGQVLNNHTAGKEINVDANNLFRRKTDKFIKQQLGKQPLDVGADRIARTAYSALKILGNLRCLTKKEIDLAWNNKILKDISAIEVYPAATLECYGIVSSGYKDRDKISLREKMIESLRKHLNLSIDIKLLKENADVLDSVLCLLAAKDFLEGNVYWPEDLGVSQKEGWIWVRNAKYE